MGLCLYWQHDTNIETMSILTTHQHRDRVYIDNTTPTSRPCLYWQHNTKIETVSILTTQHQDRDRVYIDNTTPRSRPCLYWQHNTNMGPCLYWQYNTNSTLGHWDRSRTLNERVVCQLVNVVGTVTFIQPRCPCWYQGKSPPTHQESYQNPILLYNHKIKNAYKGGVNDRFGFIFCAPDILYILPEM